MNAEFESGTDEKHDYATSDITSPFDIVISKHTNINREKPYRITYTSPSGITHAITLERESTYDIVLFEAFSTSFQTEWFAGLSEHSKFYYYYCVKKFIEWLNKTDYQITNENSFRCLKEYEMFILNEQGLKQSPIGHLNKILSEGLYTSNLSDIEIRYLEKLLQLTKPIKFSEPESTTLTEWFALPWLRSILGEDNYLQLESPRRIYISFRVTIAVTLLYLLEIRKQWQKSQPLTFSPNYLNWQYDWNPLLISHIGSFDEAGEPSNDLSQLLWLDTVKSRYHDQMKEIISALDIRPLNLKKRYRKNRSRYNPWQNPVFFKPAYQHCYSALEEQLLAWLVACESVQPSDIKKLKTTDYACELNSSGRLIAMECAYYKGRSGGEKRPAILMGSDIWTQALFHYIQGLPSGSPLFQTHIEKSICLPGFGKFARNNSYFCLLFRIWKLPGLQRRIHFALTKHQATPIFLNAVLALENGDEPYSIFTRRANKTVGEYRAHFLKPLPPLIFTLTHIKTTAVHSGSDAYRDSDLINHHSHTSKTEKHSYLTDSNKDFVNRAGRITRLVLHDLQNVVYQPSVSCIQQAVNDLELRTVLMNVTGAENAKVLSLDQTTDKWINGTEIIIPDTTDNALVFIHYITQAEHHLSMLIATRPDWVERTLIVQIEWITRTLSKMRSANAAQNLYSSLSAHLPPLFDHILETIE